MNIKNAPCYKCENRKLGCHSDCDKYKEWARFQHDAKYQMNIQINPKGCAYFKKKVTEYGVYRSKKKYR